jgi:hypothetical protein
LQSSCDVPTVQREHTTYERAADSCNAPSLPLPPLVLPDVRFARSAAIPDHSPLFDGSDDSDDLDNDGSTFSANTGIPKSCPDPRSKSLGTNIGSGNDDTSPAATPEHSNPLTLQMHPVMLSRPSVRLRDAAQSFSSWRKRRECDTGSNDKPTRKLEGCGAKSKPDDDHAIELEELRFDDFSKCDQGHTAGLGCAIFIFDGCKNVTAAWVYLCLLPNAARCAAKHTSKPAVAPLARFVALSIGKVPPKPSISSS